MTHTFRTVLLATTAIVPLGLAPALANPVGAQVVGGKATVQGQGTPSVTVTQSTDKAIINWQSFNIGAGEATRFVQPGASSIALNRVTGNLGPSQLYGSLTANGRIFLVNPDGILVGPGARIDTAGFLATTHDIRNDDFMAGRYVFGIPGRPDASVVNQGAITAHNSGFAGLVAPGVRNAGTITATLGKVGLAAGNGFTLDFYGDKLITLSVGDSVAATVKDVATGQPLNALVRNDGTLRANGGRVELTAAAARQVVDSVINNKGVIEANSIGTQNGMIVLGAATGASKPAGAPTQTVKLSGTLSAAGKNTGEKGGKVVVSGEAIEVSAARIDTSGDAGGGTVLVGGDVSGGKPNPAATSHPKLSLEAEPVPNASEVTVDAATIIDASATSNGDGGKVVLWADHATTFLGTILARGGAASGDGGFVETSGHVLGVTGAKIDTSAPNGRTGSWLLDPFNLTIDLIAASTIAANLDSSNVTILTTATGFNGPGNASPGSGDIEVASNIIWNSGNTLTLSAYRQVTVNDGVTIANTGAGSLVLRADNTGTGIGIVTFNGTGKADFSASTGLVSIFSNPGGNIAVLANFNVPNQISISLPVDPVAYMTGIFDPWSPAAVGGCQCLLVADPGSLDTAMNNAFGVGQWTKFQGFNTAPLSPAYRFVYIDGGDGTSTQFNNFIGSNVTALQNYVSAGGTLFINAARWDNTSLNLGFGATLVGPNYSANGKAVDLTHAIFKGPIGSAGTQWTGTAFSHDVITGAGLRPLITGDFGTVLADRRYGSGYVMLGSLTAPFFHSPKPQAINLFANILTYTAAQYAPLLLITLPPGTSPFGNQQITNLVQPPDFRIAGTTPPFISNATLLLLPTGLPGSTPRTTGPTGSPEVTGTIQPGTSLNASDLNLFVELFQSPSIWEKAGKLYDLVGLVRKLSSYNTPELIETLKRLEIFDPTTLPALQQKLVSKTLFESAVGFLYDFVVDAALDQMEREGKLPIARPVIESYSKTIFNFATANLTGQIVDQTVLIMKEYTSLNRDAKSIVDGFVQFGLAELNALQQARDLRVSGRTEQADRIVSAVSSAISTRTAIINQLADGLWPAHIDAANKWYVIEAIMRAKDLQAQGKDASSQISIAKELAASLDNTQWVPNLLLGTTPQYTEFAQGVAQNYGVVGW